MNRGVFGKAEAKQAHEQKKKKNKTLRCIFCFAYKIKVFECIMLTGRSRDGLMKVFVLSAYAALGCSYNCSHRWRRCSLQPGHTHPIKSMHFFYLMFSPL